MALLHEEITAKVLEAAFEVSSELGTGFLEAVYQYALLTVLEEKGLQVACEVPLQVNFRGRVIGNFKADLVVKQVVLVELKAVGGLLPEHKAQVINYLKASGLEVGLLINFGRSRLEYYRLENPSVRKGLPKLSQKENDLYSPL